MIKFIFIANFFIFSSFLFSATCTKSDQAMNMCKGFGYCTMFPIGAEGHNCGSSWTIPNDWKAMSKDCLSNQEENKTYSCNSKGIIKTVICGKTNCFICECQ